MKNKSLKVRVTKVARKTCNEFLHHTECLICTAVKRKFPGAKTYAMFSSVDIVMPGEDTATRYLISKPQRVSDSYDVPTAAFKPFDVTLAPVEFPLFQEHLSKGAHTA